MLRKKGNLYALNCYLFFEIPLRVFFLLATKYIQLSPWFLLNCLFPHFHFW